MLNINTDFTIYELRALREFIKEYIDIHAENLSYADLFVAYVKIEEAIEKFQEQFAPTE